MAELDQLAKQYTRTGEGFNDLYREFDRQYSGRYEAVAHWTGADVHSVQAAYEDTLLNCLRRYKPGRGVFSHYLSKSLANVRTDLFREQQQQRRNVAVGVAVGINDLLHQRAADIGGRVMDRHFITEAVQAALSQDTDMLRVLMLVLDGYSVHGAAVKVGICHKTAKRRLIRVLGNMKAGGSKEWAQMA